MEIDENIYYWKEVHSWKKQGEEWSEPWGNAEQQWFSCIFPRVQKYLPCGSILEIACGYGRWTNYLKQYTDNLLAVDLTEECIDACRSRFGDSASFFLNDGKSLDMIESSSIDFAYSFDSLVHAGPEVIESYLSQMDRILTKDGVFFLHHSNLRAIKSLIGYEYAQLRAPDVDASLIKGLCENFNLSCITQELVNWRVESFVLDCFSTITRRGSRYDKQHVTFTNLLFMEEARLIKRMAPYYSSSTLNEAERQDKVEPKPFPTEFLV